MSDTPIQTSSPRFAPVMRSVGVEEGLAARLADPLWLLARQWQFGEFRGHDAGSPVSVQMSATAHRPTWWRPEPDPTQPTALPYRSWDVSSGPLEPQIEAETADGTAVLRLRLEGGVRARRDLLAAGIPAATAQLATVAAWDPEDVHPADVTNAVDRTVMASVADAANLAAKIQPWADPATPPPAAVLTSFAVDAADTTVFAATMRTWLQWWLARSPAPAPGPLTGPVDPPAWDPHRLEHRGSLAFASAPDTRLQIDRHPGGPLDWYSVDIRTGDPSELSSAPAPPPQLSQATPVRATGVPQPATFAGMPARRFWEFEDARVGFGSIDASPADLARLLLVEYTTVYDHDWYVTPLRVPVGALVHVDQPVMVKDSFGQSYPLEPFAEKPGAHTRIYTLNAPDAGATTGWSTRWFWFAPRLASVLDSDPVEVVNVRRDEMANVAWAIVTRAADPFGRPTTIRSAAAGAPSPPQPGAPPPPRYTVESPVATNWYPLIPTPLSTLGAYRLVLGGLVRGPDGRLLPPSTPAASPTQSPPPGWLLATAAAQQWWIYEEELSRAGATLNRTVTVGRWHDGRRYRWTNRSAWLGGGEANSGLTWDYLI